MTAETQLTAARADARFLATLTSAAELLDDLATAFPEHPAATRLAAALRNAAMHTPSLTAAKLADALEQVEALKTIRTVPIAVVRGPGFEAGSC